MPEFASVHSYQQFERSVKANARFVHEDATGEFLKAVRETAKQRVRQLPKDEILYRAQRGLDIKEMTIRMPIRASSQKKNTKS